MLEQQPLSVVDASGNVHKHVESMHPELARLDIDPSAPNVRAHLETEAHKAAHGNDGTTAAGKPCHRHIKPPKVRRRK